MATFDKPRLRNALRKLRAVEARIDGDYDPLETGQEMLDFLAVVAGLKPVFLHGRGLGDTAWMSGVVEVARGAGLRIVRGPCWNALPPGEDFPAWYAECVTAELAPYRPYYICKAPAVAREVQAICDAGGHIAVRREAGLLAYPECCVAAHHARAARFHNVLIRLIERKAEGDEARKRALYGDRFDLRIGTENVADLAEAFAVVPYPFGSWNACDSCVDEPDSPSDVLSLGFELLAETVDPALADLLRPPAEEDEAEEWGVG